MIYMSKSVSPSPATSSCLTFPSNPPTYSRNICWIFHTSWKNVFVVDRVGDVSRFAVSKSSFKHAHRFSTCFHSSPVGDFG
ncbi:hypothetical protein HanXRQr2_Chr06g0265271 [Helianthus annuus]|uniref:Uncharacterized protein n=1 Tax=Helianthus annuus TaxID=4232 RepID=A0A9K3NKF9_HELAN|nr:hypothetical protein HanXRQr2_Chr06g0265271 [Helianthus annuus]KAJ0915950.1 hypothetical protein HanPSC8_Chr06g0255881 [Helianthus annuus]